ncbi:MAG: FecR domain-containing protein [Cyclobacteriaceae bacterium]
MNHLITKYLEGDLTLDEQHELSKWLQSDERNAQTLKTIKAYWNNHKDTLHAEELEVRLRLQQMMGNQAASSTKENHNPSWKGIYRVAAVIAIVLSAVFGVHKYISIDSSESEIAAIRLIEKVSLPGQKIITKLPDGTTVKLNSDSKLIVPEKFEGDRREVTLIGEAFFDVSRDEDHPFVIKTEKLDVTVLGTSFNVKAYGSLTPEVAVKTGKVAVRSSKNEMLKLIPNEMVSYYNDAELHKTIISNNHNPFGWTNQQLVFNDESLNNVLEKISRWYGIEIEKPEGFKTDRKYTATYDNPTIKEVMEVLTYVYDIKYQYNAKEMKILIQ